VQKRGKEAYLGWVRALLASGIVGLAVGQALYD